MIICVLVLAQDYVHYCQIFIKLTSSAKSNDVLINNPSHELLLFVNLPHIMKKG